VDWLNPSSQLARMNFALDLAAGAVAGVTVDARAMLRSASANPEDARSVASALDAEIFAKGLSGSTIGAIGRLVTGGPVSIAVRGLGLALASPEMQVR
jgi:hypothetical protein